MIGSVESTILDKSVTIYFVLMHITSKKYTVDLNIFFEINGSLKATVNPGLFYVNMEFILNYKTHPSIGR